MYETSPSVYLKNKFSLMIISIHNMIYNLPKKWYVSFQEIKYVKMLYVSCTFAKMTKSICMEL